MSRASIRKHPIHPMLIVFPIGGGTMVYIHHVGVQPAKEPGEQERRIA